MNRLGVVLLVGLAVSLVAASPAPALAASTAPAVASPAVGTVTTQLAKPSYYVNQAGVRIPASAVPATADSVPVYYITSSTATTLAHTCLTLGTSGANSAVECSDLVARHIVAGYTQIYAFTEGYCQGGGTLPQCADVYLENEIGYGAAYTPSAFVAIACGHSLGACAGPTVNEGAGAGRNYGEGAEGTTVGCDPHPGTASEVWTVTLGTSNAFGSHTEGIDLPGDHWATTTSNLSSAHVIVCD
ncbi:MAG TPA: hypothetical protein VH478_05875 [Trebonia sp.]|nr:hypothetical protein [Trebonia sp.]